MPHWQRRPAPSLSFSTRAERETTVDNGKPIVRCFPGDITLDRTYVLRSMSNFPAQLVG
jgi:hypothetical protein